MGQHSTGEAQGGSPEAENHENRRFSPKHLGTVLEQFRLKRSVLIVRVIVHSLAGGLKWKPRKDFLI